MCVFVYVRASVKGFLEGNVMMHECDSIYIGGDLESLRHG